MADKRLLVGAIDAAGDTLFGSWAGVSGAGAAVQRSASLQGKGWTVTFA